MIVRKSWRHNDVMRGDDFRYLGSSSLAEAWGSLGVATIRGSIATPGKETEALS